jgi:hypothetical protein
MHLGTLLGCQALQAGPPGCFVSPRLHRQQPRSLRIAQVGQHCHVQLVALLQADLVHAYVDNRPRRVDGLGFLQLISHDATYGLCGDAQSPSYVLLGAADQQPNDVLLEGIGVAGVLTFEWRDQVLTMMAARTAVEDPFVGPETRLAPHVKMPHYALLAALFQPGLILVVAALALALLGPGPRDFEAVTVATAFVCGNFHAFGQIDVDGDASHSRPWQRIPPAVRSTARPFQLSTIESSCRRGNPQNPCGLHLRTEEP